MKRQIITIGWTVLSTSIALWFVSPCIAEENSAGDQSKVSQPPQDSDKKQDTVSSPAASPPAVVPPSPPPTATSPTPSSDKATTNATGANSPAKAENKVSADPNQALKKEILDMETSSAAMREGKLAAVRKHWQEIGPKISQMKSTVQLVEQQMGRGHPNFISVYCGLGNMYKGSGMYDDARPIYEWCLPALDSYLRSGNPYHIAESELRMLPLLRAMSAYSLGDIYLCNHRYEDAARLFNQSLPVLEHMPKSGPLGDISPILWGHYRGMAIVSVHRNDYAKAAEYLKKVKETKPQVTKKTPASSGTVKKK